MAATIMQLAKDAREIYSITHRTDFDGMASAALLVRHLSMPLANARFAGPALADLKPPVDQLLSLRPKGCLIVFTDVSVNDPAVAYIVGALKALKRAGNRIAWLDHHPWSADAAKKIKRECNFIIYGEGDRCATELVALALRARDRYTASLTTLAHAGDFNLKPPKGQGRTMLRLSGAIAAANYISKGNALLKRMVKDISEGDFRSPTIKRLAGLYVRESTKNASLLKRNCRAFDVNGYRVGIGYARWMQSTHACAVIQKRLGTDMEAFINLSHSYLNLRSREGIDCSAIAKRFGGGGHPKASGARLKVPLSTRKDIEACIGMVIRTAGAALPKRAAGK